MLMVAAQIRCSSRMRPVQNCRVACDSVSPVGHSARNTSTLQHQQRRRRTADLPEPAELDVGQPLIAEPEPAFVDVAHDAEIVADQRAGDDEQRDPEQEIDQQSLALRLAAAGDRRREEQAGADPADSRSR